MEKTENKYVATLLKKHIIGDTHILYIPIKSLCGKLDRLALDDFYDTDDDEDDFDLENEGIDIFIDDTNDMYQSIYTSGIYFSDEEYVYGNLVKVDDLLKEVDGETDEDKLRNAMDYFFDNTYSLLYDVAIKNNDVRIIAISLESFLAARVDTDAIAKKTEDENENANENAKKTSISYLDNILSLLTNNKFNVDELKTIKNNIISLREHVDVVDKLVDAELDKKYATSDYNAKEEMYKNLFSDEKYLDNLGILNEKYKVNTFDRNKVYEAVSSVVISQDEQIERLLSELQQIDIAEAAGMDNPYAILLTGSTGVGKTAIMSQVAKNIGRQLMIVDSTQLTKAGYVGEDIENILYQLYLSCNKNLEATERSIIYFDEIDKMGSERNSDVNGKGVLNALLKFVDGTTYRARPSIYSDRKDKTIEINTSKMRVVFGGAFTNVYKNLDEINKQIGFGEAGKIVTEPTIDHFVKIGLIPDEFIGRSPLIIHLNDLSEADLKKILLTSNTSEVRNLQRIFKKIGYDLRFADGYITEIAHQAYLEKTGARSLKRRVSDSAWKAFNDAVDHIDEFDTVEFTKATAIDNSQYNIYKKEKVTAKEKKLTRKDKK